MQKKYVFTISFILICSIYIVFLNADTCTAVGSTIYVDNGGGADYTSIQDAIDIAGYGDTIYVYSGIYYESITIKISIILEGEDKETTLINSGDKGHTINVKNTNNVIIKNLSITAGWKDFGGGAGTPYSGIRFTGVNESIIENCNISNCGSNGIYISYSDSYNNIIFNNICSNNVGNGICLSGSFNNSIENCNCSNNGRYGIDISSNNNHVINNTIFSNGWVGVLIFTSESQNNVLYHNKFKDNTINAADHGSNIWYSIELHEGNYWDDYKDIDNNSDGIGDTPYTIDGNNKDEYPLGYFKEEIYKPPNATFFYSPKEPIVNQTVTFFLPENFDEYGEITYYKWDFGDGKRFSYNNKNNRNHIYENAGKYNVTLIIKNEFGYEDSFSTTIKIMSSSEKENNTPGYELLIAFCSIILSLYLIRIRNKIE